MLALRAFDGALKKLVGFKALKLIALLQQMN